MQRTSEKSTEGCAGSFTVKSAENAAYADNEANLRLAACGDESATERLIVNNYPLVAGIARRFSGRGVELEDLIQIGLIGMLKAIRSFDIERGNAFSTYAVPLIMGEIRRYLRDDGLIKVSRIYKRNGAIVLRAAEEFRTEMGKEPTVDDLCRMTGIASDDVITALESTSPVLSLSDPTGDDDSLTLEKTVASDTCEIERTMERLSLKQALGAMPVQWRQIVICRYFKDMSQQETADLMGLTQVKVSRTEKKIFEALRREMSS
jgi:RNA polymerase sporulation-specific sigma factor